MSHAIIIPVMNLSVRGLCVKPYPNHARGCPNHNKRPSCPPKCKTLPEILDLTKPIFVIWNEFDIGSHVERMRAKHPGWSDRQLFCCLYWQPKARLQLKDKIEAFLRENPGLRMASCPEGNGVDITATMASIGIRLEWPPLKIARQVVLAGTPKARVLEPPLP